MRILHVVLSLELGGQERLIADLSHALKARGHDVHVLSLTPGGSMRAELGGIDVIDIPKRDGLDLSLPLRLAPVLRQLQVDVAHTHNPIPLIYAAPVARLARVRRVVHTKHGANIYSSASLAAARVATRALTAFVGVSAETAAIARTRERVPERLLHVIQNGIPLERFRRDLEARARIRAELGIPGRAVVVGTVGRLSKEKDHPLLVRALRLRLGPEVRLVIVGDGPYRSEIEHSIGPEAARYVTLTGERRDVPALLSAFDVFAMSSRTEGLPLVVPEAMAARLPVVVTAVGGLPGIVGPEVGLVVPPGDADALGRALSQLIDDPARRVSLGEAARRFADQSFSIDRMVREYEALYS